jgi:hypothetical protein
MGKKLRRVSEIVYLIVDGAAVMKAWVGAVNR